MSSTHSKPVGPAPNPIFDEKQWVIHVERTLDEELEEETETQASIFHVPKLLLDLHPHSYVPQQVAIGPYHSAREETRDMERYKLAAAKRNQSDFKTMKLKKAVMELMEYETKIRANYQTLLEFSGETLAWMMAVDASFLLEFLQVCAINRNKDTKDTTTNVMSARLTRLAHLGRNKAVHNSMLKDTVLVENQIPLFVLRKLLEMYFSSLEKADELLFSMLVSVCEELSPFKMVENSKINEIEVREFDHLLDFLYHYVVPKFEDLTEDIVVEISKEEEGRLAKDGDGGDEEDQGCLHTVKVKLMSLHGVVTFTKKIIFSKPVKMVVKLPWIILSNLPMLRRLKEPLENFFGNLENQEDGEDGEGGSNEAKSPLLEEIEIPSVTKLANTGIRFEPTDQGISSISYDCKTRVFTLPVINLDVNSTVVLRNLVAYEICSTPGPLVLTRYTELMNGIIDSAEDAQFLRERGIVVNRLKSDDEVANLWNGMSKSIRLTKVPFLDKVIGDVNKDYSGRWKVKFENAVKKYVFGSWKILTLFGAMFMIVLMALQAFCSVYNCSRIMPIESLS